VVLLVINVILLMLGCFMEGIAVILLTVPIFMPVVTQLGVDPVHFGLIVTLNSMVGLLTPPVGMVLYTMASVAKVSVMDLAHGLRWHIAALILVLFLVTQIPIITTFLPNLLMGIAR
jgi:TRAP-type C4-dicarboxylate transport system permease large subunit